MNTKATQASELSQLDKFKEAARDLETDDDEARFDERMRKLMKQKPGERKSGGG